MAAQPLFHDAPFERALEEFKEKLPAEERISFEATTLEDLQAVILAIQAKQASTRTLKNLRRLEGFLEAMKSNADIIEVFLNVHPFVSFIWVSNLGNFCPARIC